MRADANEGLPMIERGPVEQHGMLLRAWHLAILRFALTRDNADRLGVLAVANSIDRLGWQPQAREGFSFFRKTSADLCAAITGRQRNDDVILSRYLTQVDDVSLRHSLAGALGLSQPMSKPERRRAGRNQDLWRGLPSRVNARP